MPYDENLNLNAIDLDATINNHLALLNESRRGAAWWDTPGFELVHRESDEPRRWLTMTTTVLRHKATGLLYAIVWDKANTEEGEHEYDEDAVAVFPEARVVTVTDYVSANGSRYATKESK